jgi:YVTN family beta-propeller protein
VRPTVAQLALVLGLCAAGSAPAAPFAYITNQGSHDVSVVDLASQQVVATVPVGRSPAGVVAASASGRVYVSNPDSHSISVIDMRSQRVVATLPAGQGPVGMDASADGRLLFVADWYANQLLAYDTTQPNAAPGRTDIGKAPAGVAAAGGALAWVAERDDDRVALVDTASRQVLARVPVGDHPYALLLDAPRQRLYVLNVQSNDVSVLDTVQRRVLATVKVGKAPYGAALADGGRLLYITNQHDDSVSVIDADRLTVTRTLSGFGYPEGVASHGNRVYVVNWMDEQLSVLDAASGRLLAQVATGRNPRGFGAFIGAPP